jgi:glutaredoxin 3
VLSRGKADEEAFVELGVVDVQMYTAGWCSYCVAAKRLLQAKDVAVDEIDVGDNPSFRQIVFEATGGWTVPQIVIDGRPIGGYMELRSLEADGRLDELLAA